jgi:hypothetical protein
MYLYVHPTDSLASSVVWPHAQNRQKLFITRASLTTQKGTQESPGPATH